MIIPTLEYRYELIFTAEVKKDKNFLFGNEARDAASNSRSLASSLQIHLSPVLPHIALLLFTM
ncbi:MAG: hypothetical protein WA364_05850 [Candidatus Nitrosopolaris sp.]